ncbi:MAG: fumarylacetoacetate hydrolase family protein [Hyphomicrobiaceae bacterium]|nr:fumarylacetoacetate hydrolase family protein [Hyphomicrobiaceae bacterium]
MKIARCRHASRSEPFYALVEGAEVVCLGGTPLEELHVTEERLPLSEVAFMAPCVPSKIVAGGANYRGHLEELKLPLPTAPVFFIKPPSSLIGHKEPIVYPTAQTDRLEFEAELGIVLKAKLRNASPEEALAGILGYTCVNDVTARDIQLRGGNFIGLSHSKAFDTFCPCGPWIETDVGNPNTLQIQLTLNGVVKQESNTGDMLFSVQQMVSYFSQVMTLFPGDLILTATPAGAGRMEAGDLVEVSIQSIGTLSNRVVEPSS